MEMVRVASELLRVLLALAALSGLSLGLSVVADITTLPEIDINTLLDDEDLSITEKRASVQLAVDLQSNVRFSECLGESLSEVTMNEIKTKLLSDMNETCKCLQDRNNVISKDKIECEASNLIRYSCEIPNWSSLTFDTQKLSDFLRAWSAVITVNGADVNFTTIENYKFSFNVTGTQVIIVTTTEEGSGGGPDMDLDGLGSGEEMGTIESIVDENKTGGVNGEVVPVGLDPTSGGGEMGRVHVGALVTLCVAALTTVFSCVVL